MLKIAEAFVNERVYNLRVNNIELMLISLIDYRGNFDKFCMPQNRVDKRRPIVKTRKKEETNLNFEDASSIADKKLNEQVIY